MNLHLPTHRVPTHPGEMLLKEFLEPLGITQSDAAQRLAISFPRLNEIVNGKRGVTPDTALRLERFLGVTAQFWMNLQQNWDLWHALRKAGETLKQIKPVKRTAVA